MLWNASLFLCWKSFLKFFVWIFCRPVCLCEGLCCERSCLQRPVEALGSLELEFQTVANCLTLVQGTEFGSFARAVCVLDSWVFSLCLLIRFLWCLFSSVTWQLWPFIFSLVFFFSFFVELYLLSSLWLCCTVTLQYLLDAVYVYFQSCYRDMFALPGQQ